VVVLSSGPDSEALIAELLAAGWEVLPLYVRCGFRWEAPELSRLRRVLRGLKSRRLAPLAVVAAPMGAPLRGHWSLTGRGVPDRHAAWDSVYLPGRNAVLLTEAWILAVRARARAVAIGSLKGNPFPDATPAFRRAMARALNLGLSARVSLLAPYARLTKLQVLRRARRFRQDLAFSCLSPRRGRPCGRCSKCGELSAALGRLRAEARPSSPRARRRRRPGP
jgi:7-cyano-7-deazaguanine synthase in queuosine biosynthesis